MKKRGQYATEYLIVIGFSILLLVPLLSFIVGHYSDITYTFNSYQAYSVVGSIRDSALKVYHLGEGSVTTLSISVPGGIINSSLKNGEVKYTLNPKLNLSTEIYVLTPINISGYLPEKQGKYHLRIESRGDHVWVS